MKIFNQKVIGDRENVKVKRQIYDAIPKGMILSINHIQRNYYGPGNHRYWAMYEGTNWYFNQKEIEPV